MNSVYSSTRRRLIGGAFGTALAAGLSTAVAGPRATAVNSWDEEFDIIIVGSGFAGLSAAYAALKDGVKKIVVLEKMEVTPLFAAA